MIQFNFIFEGNEADSNTLDFYDVAQAMVGFQRSLAITTNLIINGEVITQAPSLKNARILAKPPEEGSWKAMALITAISTGAYHLFTTPKDTPLGHLVYSAYDYVVSETMGFHVDYDQSLGQQYEKLKSDEENLLPIIEQSQLDSVIEKCESSIIQMHRPITFSQTATRAKITRENQEPIGPPLSHATYEYVRFSERSNEAVSISGRISSYNINTYTGRIFIPEEARPITFFLADNARSKRIITKITLSLTMNAEDRFRHDGNVNFLAYRNLSRTGRLKSIFVIGVEDDD